MTLRLAPWALVTAGLLAATAAACSPEQATTPPATRPAVGVDVILGRPTAESMTASVSVASPAAVAVRYRALPRDAARTTATVELRPGPPHAFELTGLRAGAAYAYAVVVDGVAGEERTVHTQRAPGDWFTFTVTADAHLGDPNADPQVLAATLANAAADGGDFHIDLGDLFMTEKLPAPTRAAAERTFADARPALAPVAAGAPLFLVNGNHEGELGWLAGKGRSPELPAWSADLRAAYYPTPVPGGFYSGAADADPLLGRPRDAYYAWRWGDALFVVLDPFWYTVDKPRPGAGDGNWGWTLGRAQYDWLRATLESSTAAYTFVFVHHLVGGGDDARGGTEVAGGFEWGGNDADGADGFERHRPGWGTPIHDLLAAHHVTAVFHGHDHVYVRQELDGIVYQELAQPDARRADNTQLATDYGYRSGVVLGSSGHLRVRVSPVEVTVEYVRARLPGDGRVNGEVSDRYTLVRR